MFHAYTEISELQTEFMNAAIAWTAKTVPHGAPRLHIELAQHLWHIQKVPFVFRSSLSGSNNNDLDGLYCIILRRIMRGRTRISCGLERMRSTERCCWNGQRLDTRQNATRFSLVPCSSFVCFQFFRVSCPQCASLFCSSTVLPCSGFFLCCCFACCQPFLFGCCQVFGNRKHCRSKQDL